VGSERRQLVASEVKPAPKSSMETTNPISWSFWMANWERSKSAIASTTT
jgi:hypothetical protein